jgi:glutathione synthase/RimK-type ligase-like ATP-grasp enzyme
MRKYNYFPLVGILTSKGKKADSFCGDVSVFKAIQKELMAIGGLSFIFTTEGVHKDSISGYIYFDHHKKWGKIIFPFPDLIFNKVSSRKEETTSSFLSLYHLYTNEKKPFFNRCFFDKWDCYFTLSQSMELLPYLPETFIYSNINVLLDKLHNGYSFYMKPVNGHKGIGIYKLSFDGEFYYIHHKANKVRLVRSAFIQHINRLVKKQQYLIQTEIQTDKLDHCKYDLRILCIYEKDSHKISGIGVRKATKNSIITHVPNGGELVSFELIKEKCSISQLNWLAEKIGHELMESYGFIGEFSIDIGLTPDGKPFIFEVNSKPMIFDEYQIQEKRVIQLVGLFKQLTNTTNPKKKEI